MEKDRIVSKIQSLLYVFFLLICGGLVLTSCTGCSPAYVIRAAYEQGRIMSSREKISDIVSLESTPASERQKLILVRDARQYAISLGLNPGNSFTKYARVDREYLSWLVLGSRPDKFELFMWWFPIVGSVPYKGYFEKEDADAEALRLERKGFETWVRGSEAFSSLGWFDDPVLSTTLKNSPPDIVNTVLHESFHTTLWVADQVAFNESLANFIGCQAATAFFNQKYSVCINQPQNRECSTELQLWHKASRDRCLQDIETAKLINALYNDLNTLYTSDRSREEKIRERIVIFDRHLAPLRQRYPNMRTFKKINNGEVMQLRLYYTNYQVITALFNRLNNEISKFISVLVENKNKIENSSSPFDELEKL